MSTASTERTGLWLIGARGSVATTTIAGRAALAAGLWPPTGLVTALPPFAASGLPDLDHLVIGGHDIADTPLAKRADELVAGGVLPHGLPSAIASELAAADTEIRYPHGDPALDIADFTRRHGLARTVVVNVATVETDPSVSTGYANAAIDAGCSYVNFTPATGMRGEGLAERATAAGLPFAGRDGKTGQTLLRAALAPMFAQRALHVRSWSGTNLLGGGDGAALADPAAAAAKNAGKERVLDDNLGALPEGTVHIDNVPALGDWKTAWDHVAFDGFLGTRMVLQTIWEGCDSSLAAPLVLDLARLVSRAHAVGLAGPVPGLGFFFKDPDSGSAALGDQWRELVALAETLRTGS
ncbi:inositol-3-phosphate synthase [Streptomyces sp. PT12]|uniref:inositol-3-phosphate synthase n=1 Tax=Streptomyces sp. PT12 TaxID=1510197 RepID=UPI000DE28201|nr:inositol-3-phosphate synthase [Streptomyces sp. PT12]RBM23293.1 myo-inositol-1-phosphate synthase [Streptomyces sp. PT12]